MLLCVSGATETEFSALLLLPKAQSNSPLSFEGLRRTLRQNFSWKRQQMKVVSIDRHPILKIAYFRQHHLFASILKCQNLQVEVFFTIGVYVEILHLLSDLNEILSQSLSKTLN